MSRYYKTPTFGEKYLKIQNPSLKNIIHVQFLIFNIERQSLRLVSNNLLIYVYIFCTSKNAYNLKVKFTKQFMSELHS